jgi:hypothetical protein
MEDTISESENRVSTVRNFFSSLKNSLCSEKFEEKLNLKKTCNIGRSYGKEIC